MSEKDICRQCSQQSQCRDAYDRMGRFRGPSVFFKVILAFLLPLVIFIVSLASLEQLLADVLAVKGLRILASFVGAGCLTVIYALIAAALSRRVR
ncbi:MAG: hypothetical protein PVG93_06900 [Phycisphaerales bacterium]|jgi:hypothetical protein